MLVSYKKAQPQKLPKSLEDKTEEELVRERDSEWRLVRAERDRLIKETTWRYERYARYERLNVIQVDDLNSLDQYVQELADVPQTQTDPYNIVWPILQVGNTNGI